MFVFLPTTHITFIQIMPQILLLTSQSREWFEGVRRNKNLTENFTPLWSDSRNASANLETQLYAVQL